jgi:peptide/nickel transport system permease protein
VAAEPELLENLSLDRGSPSGAARAARATVVLLLRSALTQGRGRLGLGLVTFVVGIAVIGPFVTPYSPTLSMAAPFSPPSGSYWLGTDTVGRDVLSRLLDGGWVILALAASATLVAVLVGAVLGCLAAHLRTSLDETIMRPLDVLMSFPQLMLGLLFLSVLGDRLWLIWLTVVLAHIPHVARTSRAAALGVRDREFVQYSQALGTGHLRIVFGELLPNISAVVLVEFGLRLTYSIGLVATLGFIGFGPPPPAPDWGGMISENLIGLLAQPWGVVAPVILIAVLTLGVNFFTDAVSRAASGYARLPGIRDES